MYNFINAVKWKFNMLKTIVWYRCWFGHIGKRSTICKPLRLNGVKNIYLGSHVRIRELSRLETIEKYDEQRFSPKLSIGDDTGFEQGLHLTCTGDMKIGRNVTVSAYVMITDTYHNYGEDFSDSVLNQGIGYKNVKIGDGCFIGLGARINPGTELGDNCIVGTNAVVLEGEYSDYSVLAGIPAVVVKRYDELEGRWKKTNKDGDFI